MTYSLVNILQLFSNLDRYGSHVPLGPTAAE